MSAPLKWPFKDPDELLDYVIDWTDRLQGDAIASSTWDVPVGITRTTDSFTNNGTVGGKTGRTFTTLWLSGGTVGASYVFTNHIVTTGGRDMDQSTKLPVKVR